MALVGNMKRWDLISWTQYQGLLDKRGGFNERLQNVGRIKLGPNIFYGANEAYAPRHAFVCT